MQIYLARNNVQAGPYTLEQLNNMLASGEVILDDLMWHEGMENWQRVGSMTGEAWFYQPNGKVTIQNQPNPTPTASQNSVDRLYGRASSTGSNITPDKLKKSPLNHTKNNPATQTNELASISSRILAVLIDQVLALLCFVPLLAGINFNIMQMMEALGNYTALKNLMNGVPSHLLLMATLMLLGLLAIQVAMLIKRGQSIGKLAMGIQILDFESKQIPGITNIILIRTILTNIAYSIPFGIFVALADFIVMLNNKEHRSIHDKLAKTYVVKAQDNQVEK